MDSSVSPTHGEQEMSVWNGHCPRCGSGPRHPPVLPERRKSAKIRAGLAVHMGNPGLDGGKHHVGCEKTLDQFLQNPTGDVHGSRMFLTVPNAADRQNANAYLETLK
jgi:hypothetical protein